MGTRTGSVGVVPQAHGPSQRTSIPAPDPAQAAPVTAGEQDGLPQFLQSTLQAGVHATASAAGSSPGSSSMSPAAGARNGAAASGSVSTLPLFLRGAAAFVTPARPVPVLDAPQLSETSL